jgi:hypothetical protein
MPKRSEERTRRNATGADGLSITKGTARGGKPFPANKDWDPLTRKWYDAIKKSGIADYYEQSDWAMALIIANELDAYYKEAAREGGKRSAMMLASILSAMGELGLTEGDRRRMKIELEKPKEDEKPAELIAIDGYKDMLGIGN